MEQSGTYVVASATDLHLSPQQSKSRDGSKSKEITPSNGTVHFDPAL